MTLPDVDMAPIAPYLRERMRDLVQPLIDLVEREHPEQGDFPNRTGKSNLLYLLETAATDRALPMDKLQRWVGFVQGVLAARGLLDVDAERDRTRQLFHEVYMAAGLEAPESREMPRKA